MGPKDYFDQADRLVRAELWMHALGIPSCEYSLPGNLDDKRA